MISPLGEGSGATRKAFAPLFQSSMFSSSTPSSSNLGNIECGIERVAQPRLFGSPAELFSSSTSRY